MRAILAVGLGLTLVGSVAHANPTPSPSEGRVGVPAALLGGIQPANTAGSPAVSLGPVQPAATLGLPVADESPRFRGQEPVARPVSAGMSAVPRPPITGYPPTLPEPARPSPTTPPGWGVPTPPPPLVAGPPPGPVTGPPPPIAYPGTPVGPVDDGAGDWGDAFADDDNGPMSRFWFGAEYLHYWIRRSNAPPLLTTAPFNPNDPGRFRGAFSPGETPFVQILAGGDTVFPEEFTGARTTFGYWFDDSQIWGIEGRGFFLGQRENIITADTMTFPLLGRPFFNLNSNMQDAELVSRPDIIPAAMASVRASTELWGAELNARRNLLCGCRGWLDLVFGGRYLNLEETLRVDERVLRTGAAAGAIPPFPTPYFQTAFDQFTTHNEFFGGQVGLAGEIRRGRWALDGRATVALGNTRQQVDITGAQTITQPGQMTRTFTGGLLATPTNIGSYTRDRFSVVPEVGVNVGYYLTERLKLAVGYNFLYWSNVVRPGEQIDPALNLLFVPNVDRPVNGSIPFNPALRPAFSFRETDFWASGINLSLQYNW